jgi:hypothetical protein
MPGPSTAIASGNVENFFMLQVAVPAGAAIGAATTVERTYTVPGLLLGDIVTVVKPQLDAGLGVVNARVSAPNTLAIQFVNATAGNVSLTASNYLLFVARSTYDNPSAQLPTAIS